MISRRRVWLIRYKKLFLNPDMKVWLSKNSEVPMREQLVTQITLGVASGDLAIGDRLPSRQEISRRFGIHANTVSNAYRELSELGLIEFRQGSGFYVNEIDSENLEDKIEIDTLITKFFQSSQSLGFSMGEIKEALEKRLSSKTPKSFLVIESEKDLRDILVSEISESTRAKVFGITFEDFENEHREINSNFVTLLRHKAEIEEILDADQTCFFLKSSSVPNAMEGRTRPSEDSLIVVASALEKFRITAKTFLVAAQIDTDSIILRSPRDENWKRGLDNVQMIICDSLTAKEFPKSDKVRVFPLVSDDSIKDLRQMCKPSYRQTA